MKRKLVILNVALVALIGAACWQLRVQWIQKKQRENSVLSQKMKPVPPLPYTPPVGPQPVVPAQYIDVASKDLFSKDRNPEVVKEVPPPPPPPPPMPALPVVKGILNIDGVTAIMSEPGKTIGEFKLLAINNQEIVLEWDGKEVRRKVEELFDRGTPEPAAAPAQAQNTGIPAPSPPPTPHKDGPGTDIGLGRKACGPGDTTPVGTIVDGLKKITWDTPFAKGCAWEPANK